MLIWSNVLSPFLRRLFRKNERQRSSPLLSESAKLALEAIVATRICDETLFATALTHRSALDFLGKDRFVSNERLEFLGDAVLDLVIAEHLYKLYPDFNEGALTKLRSQLVNAKVLAQYARRFDLGKLLIVSDSAEQNGVRESETALADAFEALIGAVYLDSGYERARAFLEKTMIQGTNFAALVVSDQNFKSALLEYAQGERLPLPSYFVISEEGPPHKKIFKVGVRMGDEVLGEGTGKSKKAAEQLAAKEAYEKIVARRNLQTAKKPEAVETNSPTSAEPF
ncbi:MAG: ribonuclease III [Chloroherpetonaceae bacterium]|nr:ribonuclease III [Chloroherpetonaceae bacterium]MDW8437355.1 ribonuclease III [Chloroherpetonaceae bacterium]